MPAVRACTPCVDFVMPPQDLMDVLAHASQALPVHIWRPFDEMPPAEHWEQYGGIVAVAGGVAVSSGGGA